MVLLVGATMLAYAQGERKKPAKDYQSPTLIPVDPSKASQNGQQLLKEKLQLQNTDDLKSVSTEKDDLGFTHEKFQHYYKGVKVQGSVYSVHSREGKVSHMTGKYYKIEDLDMTTKLSGSAALEKAKADITAQKFIWDEEPSKKPAGELVVLSAATTGDEARLAYEFEVIALRPYQRYEVLVDAKTGEVIKKWSKIHFADAVGTVATRYSGTQSVHTDSYTGGYRLRDYTRGSGLVTWDATTATGVNNSTGLPTGSSDYSDSDNNWTYSEYHNADKDDAGLEAHFGATATYDFFYTTFGRNSYNGSGATINSYANTDIEDVYGYPSGYNDNAFWTGYGMVYGKGGSYDPLTTLDVTGHEIGHAFTEYTANLVYEKEAGAMNESFSDIWGTCVENYANNTYGTSKDLWNLASEIGATFRSMSNPNAYGQPDTYGGTYWVNVTSCTPSSSNDYCGVHTNSGVGNHWFYILTVGKSGTNDVGDSYSVTGIGIDKAAAIAWRAESLYLGSNDTYADWRTYAILSAEELYGDGSAEEIAVTNAWYAVGVGSEYSSTPPTCVTSPLTLSITFDNYPEETSWTVKNSSGTTVASGGTYGSQPDGSTINVNITLATAGNYTFTINDSYGDGMCCSYGSGSYTLSSGSTTIVSGGSFTSSETTSFCIDSGSADTTPPSAPTGLTASSVGQTSFTLSWTASTDNVGVTGYEVYQNGSYLKSSTGTSTSITGLTAATTYSYTVVAKDAADNSSSSSSTLSVTTASSTVSYCSASGNNASYEYIDLVQLGSISNATGSNGGYGNFTSQSAALSPGSSYTIYFSAGFSSSTYSENWRIYIDFNQNGIFTDSGEQIVSGTTSNASTYSASFSVPSGATTGSTRMRVVMAWNTTPSSCGTFSYGEVEDYSVNISSGGSMAAFGNTGNDLPAEQLDSEFSKMNFGVYPNPVTDVLNFATGDFKEISAIRIIDIGGRELKYIRDIQENQLDVSDLSPGMYLFEIFSERGKFETKFIKE